MQYPKKYAGVIETVRKTEQLLNQYTSCATDKKNYEIDGKIFTVIRHFTGEKELRKTVAELAIIRANREMGLTDV